MMDIIDMISTRLIKKNREWNIKSTEVGYAVSYGVIGGKTQHKVRIVTPKSNRTFEEQVELEINSKINKQLDKGYHKEGEEPRKVIRPMLAKDYDAIKIKFPVFGQEKLNGVRCIDEHNNGINGLFTKTGKKITSVDHIKNELAILNTLGTIAFDGELYKRGYNLQQISGAVRSKEPNEISRSLEYWIYDVVLPLPFHERNDYLQVVEGIDFVKRVRSVIINNEEELEIYYKEIVSRGGEGIILRNPEAEYQEDKRTWDLMKRKDFKDKEFVIVGVKYDVDGCVIFTCITEDGIEFDVVPKMSKEERRKLGKECIGLPLTTRYSDISSNGVPQGNPVGLCIRDYE